MPLQTSHLCTGSGRPLLVGRSCRAYTPYGFLLPQVLRLKIGFNGQLLEEFTKAHLLGNGHRLYVPELSRFCSPDSLSPFKEGGLNAYVYCSGDPVNKVDPSGQKGTGLTAMINKFGLNKKLAKAALKQMEIPATDTHMSVQRYLEPGSPPVMVYRSSLGKYSGLLQADPELAAVKSEIQGFGKELLALAAQFEVRNHRAINIDPMPNFTGGTVFVKEIRQEVVP